VEELGCSEEEHASHDEHAMSDDGDANEQEATVSGRGL
jgi:hypothetical protein